MYRNYVIKRVIYGILMYIVMVFTYSILFNSVAEKTVRSQIEEQVMQGMRAYKNLTEDQAQRVMDNLRNNKIRQYHLDEPLLSRIFWKSIDTLTFNFGKSTIIKASNGDRSVGGVIVEALPNTIVLFVTESIIVLLIGVPMGLYAARKPNGVLDRTVSSLTMITNGLPAWWLAMILIMMFSYGVHIFPSSSVHSVPVPKGIAGFVDFLWHLSLPMITLVVLGIWGTAYLTRNIVLSNLQEDFIMAARARGLPERNVLLGHTLRTSMPAIMTLAVLGLFSAIAGNIIVEGVFSWPGIGNLYFYAVQESDVPVLMGTLAIETLFNVLGFIILDIIYGILDPRIKVGGKA